MPIQWSAQMDQRLLLVYVANSNLSATAAAEGWKKMHSQYGPRSSKATHHDTDSREAGQNIPQPTKRAIMEHILKLKKSIGLVKERDSKRSKAGTRATQFPKSSDPFDSAAGLEINRDDTEMAFSIKAESPTTSKTHEGTIPTSSSITIEPDNRSLQSDSEAPMSGEETADELHPNEPQMKNEDEDEDFVIPLLDDSIRPTMSPERTQKFRQAKAKRKVVYDFDSDDDDDNSDLLRENMSATVGRSPSPPPAHVASLAVSLHGSLDGNSTLNSFQHDDPSVERSLDMIRDKKNNNGRRDKKSEGSRKKTKKNLKHVKRYIY
ncbi:uncharacterized protein MYCFIDRAFT_77959 [Pseudocercospora fijiensis CIRAD86]|uniref:Uncharacterized protein n=1 Tax=Pseudocercospora fijiensis (strain CIRAD86) TaxID=383855 RepID=M3ARW1_PSEFD|nr:uncharacterized protein MYCFIDRAFT_77959 [Pseudocercospora fijiensis CIRAD86]EME80192.1 hypothetical protein MYCFIDRAFT_77959 [Pseudocercospora fijiensis CIRAD86]